MQWTPAPVTWPQRGGPSNCPWDLQSPEGDNCQWPPLYLKVLKESSCPLAVHTLTSLSAAAASAFHFMFSRALWTLLNTTEHSPFPDRASVLEAHASHPLLPQAFGVTANLHVGAGGTKAIHRMPLM
ncbi:hypothetical protein H1C71_011867 [Ictidomys tridecemlineatus]|nr:hypothetical protein H1C71_011867 [Ictidomys tridecemlineatus]